MNNESIQKIELRDSVKIITTNQHKYLLKKQKRYHQEKVYQQLEERGFSHFLKPLQRLDTKEEVFPFIEEKKYYPEEKAIDMMHVLSLLQNKTTYYKDFSLDEMKQIYEEIKSKINYLFAYYQDLEEIFLKEVFPSPCVYLFQRNISLLFSSLLFAQQNLEEWYQMISERKQCRFVLVHHKFCLSHLLEGEIPLLISLDQLKEGLPIEDMIFFINEHCLEQNIDHLFKIYQQKYPYTKDEFLLFACLLSLPPKIEMNHDQYHSCVTLSTTFQKMNQIRLFLLKQNERYQKHHH